MQHEAPGRIYLDYNATTPVDPRVFAEMQPYFTQHFGNPASSHHAWGWTAETAVEKARARVAALLNAKPSEVTFNSCATEGNNNVFFGIMNHFRLREPEKKIRFITSAIEHSSIRKTAMALKSMGIAVDFVAPRADGIIDPAQVAKLIRPETRMMSFMWVNNEIGSINPVRELAQLAREKNILFHCDAVQAIGKIPVDVKEIPFDLLTLSAHKFYGPKGAGALYTRTGLEIEPLIYGGGQEHGARSGTLNVPAIVGLGKAAEIAGQEMTQESEKRAKLWLRLRDGIQKKIPGAQINTPTEHAFSALSVTFKGQPVDLALSKLQRLGFSTGAACGTGETWVSRVLIGIGLSEDDAKCTIRVSPGRFTTEGEIDDALKILEAAFIKSE